MSLHAAYVFEIPGHRVRYTFCECQRWFPAQRFLNRGRINGRAMVMARAVSHKGDLFSIGFSVGAGIHAVERGTDGTNHLNVRLLRISADIVGFPWSAPCKQDRKSTRLNSSH